MPLLAIPPPGLVLDGGDASQSQPAAIIGLTLNDSLMEDICKGIRSGQSLQLTLGSEPSISFGNMIQHLTSSHDPFATDIYKSAYSKVAPPVGSSDKPAGIRVGSSHMMFKTRKAPVARAEQLKTTAAEPARASKPSAATKKSTEVKATNKLGPAKKGSKNSLLNTPSFTGPNRSTPSSPSLTGVASVASPRHAHSQPSTSAPSMSASEQQAEKNKLIRFPIIHTLAVHSTNKADLWKVKKDEWTDAEFQTNLDKVADKENDRYVLRPKMFRDLDVYKFHYKQDEDRQKAIDNAVRAYDKQRINSSAPEWDRLLPKEERGTGKCLSQLQAKIATGTAKVPTINIQSATDNAASGMEDSGAEGSVISTSALKKQKPSAKKVQQKRLLGKAGVTKPLPKQVKKVTKSKQSESALSSEYISNSDDDLSDVPIPTTTNADSASSIKRVNKAAPTSAPAGTATPTTLKKSPVKKAAKAAHSETGSDTPLQKKWMSAKKSTVNKADTPQTNSSSSQSMPKPSKNPVQRLAAPSDALTSSARTPKNPVKRKSPMEETVDSPAAKKSKIDSPIRRSPMPVQKPSPATSSSLSNSTSDTTIHTRRPHKSSPLASSPPTNASDLEDNDNNSYVSSSSTDKSKSPFVQQPVDVLKATTKFKVWYKQYQAEYRALEKLSASERELRRDDVVKMLAMHDKLKRIKEEILENYNAR